MDDDTGYFDSDVTLSENKFTNSRFDFIGWSKSPNGPVVFADKASVRNLTSGNGETVTLYAVWSLNATELQKPYQEQLEQAFAGYKNSDYTDEDWSTIAKIYSDAVQVVTDADKDTSKMQKIVDSAIAGMKAVLTIELRLDEIENGWRTLYADVLNALSQKPLSSENIKELSQKIKQSLLDAQLENLAAFSTLSDSDKALELAAQVLSELESQIREIETLNAAAAWYAELNGLDTASPSDIKSTHLSFISDMLSKYNTLSEQEKEYIPADMEDTLNEALSISQSKADAMLELENAYASYELSEYSDAGKAALSAALQNGIDAVELSASQADITENTAKFIDSMDKVLTAEEEQENNPADDETSDDESDDTDQSPSDDNNDSNDQTPSDDNNDSDNEDQDSDLNDGQNNINRPNQNQNGSGQNNGSTESTESSDNTQQNDSRTSEKPGAQQNNGSADTGDITDSQNITTYIWIAVIAAILAAAVIITTIVIRRKKIM